jgi:enoyl-CoA hydratase/carnithine racemase
VGSPELQLVDLTELAAKRRLSSMFGVSRGEPVVIVHLASDAPLDARRVSRLARDELGTLPAVIVGIGSLDHPASALVDVIVDVDRGAGSDVAAIADAVARHPLAGAALCLLLRHGDDRSTAAGLVAESTTYSMLQGGPEFAAWRTQHRSSPASPSTEAEVLVESAGDTVTITLNRPHRHNAVDVGLSELLVEALTAALDAPTRNVVLRGAGPSFSSGGDLSEFGSFPDPATAHAVRLTRSAGQLVAMMADRVEARLHGVCFGAGIELSAFAGSVVAAPDTRIALPELSLGLVPGAGGTVSLPRRIGRHRTALLALTGMEINATTALSWGLVDRIVEPRSDAR